MDVTIKNGAPPGTPIYVGDTTPIKTSVMLTRYSANNYLANSFDRLAQICAQLDEQRGNTWIDVVGLDDVVGINNFCQQFDIHPLVIEDIVNTEQRAKLDVFDDYLFLVVKACYKKEESHLLHYDQISIILKENLLITFHERSNDIFTQIRKQFSNPKARLRNTGVDYLLYSLLDAVVDDYLDIIDSKTEAIENLEDELIENPCDISLNDIYKLKRNNVTLRKAIFPWREIANSLMKESSDLIKPDTTIYLRDLYDHVVRVLEILDAYRDMTATMLDIYLSSINNRMNDIMKILTMFSAIFIPLAFITGFYGMNFVNMPILKWYYGYYFISGVMALIAIGLMWFFKRKKWW